MEITASPISDDTSDQAESHTDHPDISHGFGHHQHSDHWLFLCTKYHRKITGKADNDRNGHHPQSVSAYVAGDEKQNHKAQTCHGKGQITVYPP